MFKFSRIGCGFLFVPVVGIFVYLAPALGLTTQQPRQSTTTATNGVTWAARGNLAQDIRRPNALAGPTPIHFWGVIIDVDRINARTQNFDINVYVELRWQDERLVFPGNAPKNVRLNEIWNPRLVILNQQGNLTAALPNIAEVSPDGTVTLRQRLTGKLSQSMDLRKFPMDKHQLSVHFAAVGYNEEQLQFVPIARDGLHGGNISENLSLPDWKVTDFEAKSAPYQPVKEVSTAGFALEFMATRHFAYYLWKIVLPFSVVLIMSWGAFWIRRDNVAVRVGVATSSVLTLIAHRFIVATLLPGLSYMTRLDYLTVGGTVLVLCTLITVVLSSRYDGQEDLEAAKNINVLARILFPTAYLIMLILFFVY